MPSETTGAGPTGNERMELSVIVPMYCEEDNVAPLHAAIRAALDPTGLEYEIVIVDDGSDDATFARAQKLACKDCRVRVIRFRRNYGQTAAMAAGIAHGRGRILVTMDGDLQNDPRDIPALLAEIDKGCDIAVGWRRNRQDKLLTRKIPSRVANWLIGKVTGVPIRDNGCSLKAYRADVIRSVRLYSEMHRFIPAVSSVAGARISEIGVRHHARQHGASKYGLTRIYKVLMDLITIKAIVAFTARPMLWFASLAMPLLLLAVGCIASALWVLASGATVPVPLAGTGILFAAVGGFLLLGGVLAELVHSTGDLRLDELASVTTVVHEPAAMTPP